VSAADNVFLLQQSTIVGSRVDLDASGRDKVVGRSVDRFDIVLEFTDSLNSIVFLRIYPGQHVVIPKNH